ncbi:MAG: hypothetical protein A2X17_08720 [Bacteroidetes bacterium GWF2_41_61]|jgi:ubiquinone/menaquinone biosynthesis C-methylase UbiE|nr:MAG: hypothetical protein A2X17_08720 [Bacteroidetes bacterium GWF2_41_61]PKP05625.1 MAG: hypothetical protein CVU10_09740 [Bacteroidetes bacterium HGW-Bacteroidetes-5]HBG25182.1 hypothetical protein [Rikenellaceae bacterium]
MVDYFKDKAKEWDSPMKIDMADKFVSEMFKSINFTNNLKVLELGCGTGLAGLQIAPLVKSIVFLDSSTQMIEVLKEKIEGLTLKERSSAIKDSSTIINGTIDKYTTPDIDVIFSLMAIHHIENTQKTFEHISSILKPGGLFVIGDLKEEDGSFHGGEYVPHNGFNVQQLAQQLENSDLEVVKTYTYNNLSKNGTDYEQFILISKKAQNDIKS